MASRRELERLRALLEDGVFKPVIDRTCPLKEILEAHRFVDQGHKRGTVVVSIIEEQG